MDIQDSIERENAEQQVYDYESIIEQITDALIGGFICFFNPETLELEQASAKGYYGMTGAGLSEMNEDLVDEFGMTYTEWDNYIRFEPFSRRDLLNRMDIFINNLEDESIKERFSGLEDRDIQIAQFTAIIDNAGYTNDWDMFLREQTEGYVRSQLLGTVRNRVETGDDIYSLGE